MPMEAITISCPHCLREYTVRIDLERLARVRTRAMCTRCKQSFDLAGRIGVRHGSTPPPRPSSLPPNITETSAIHSSELLESVRPPPPPPVPSFAKDSRRSGAEAPAPSASLLDRWFPSPEPLIPAEPAKPAGRSSGEARSPGGRTSARDGGRRSAHGRAPSTKDLKAVKEQARETKANKDAKDVAKPLLKGKETSKALTRETKSKETLPNARSVGAKENGDAIARLELELDSTPPPPRLEPKPAVVPEAAPAATPAAVAAEPVAAAPASVKPPAPAPAEEANATSPDIASAVAEAVEGAAAAEPPVVHVFRSDLDGLRRPPSVTCRALEALLGA